MGNFKETKYTVKSDEVRNAKVSKESFLTTIIDCTQMKGSKYVSYWVDDIYEVETSDGVFISGNDLRNYKNQRVYVYSNVNTTKSGQIKDIVWKWLNFVSIEGESSVPKFYEIQKALSLKIPKTTCYVYKIEFGKDCYVGFTTQSPEQRLEWHKSNAKEGGMAKINKAFRRWGYVSTLSVIGEYTNEIEGLISEIRNIEKYNCSLNEHPGGQGKDFNIVLNKNNFDEDIFTVHDKNDILSSDNS